MRGQALAAAITPLTDDGEIDEDAFDPYVRFLADGGIDGILALGTTGEGVLYPPDERERIARRYLQAAPEGFHVFVHCGAQSTRETVRLCAHASAAGAHGVAVIGPPYFRFDERELLAHFRAAAAACAPTPFYVYEFAARSGYAVPVGVIERLRESATNLRGLKVSDTPFDAVRPYLLEGLEVFIGSEPLVSDGMAHGAAGAVSGLAAAFPSVVSTLVHDRDPASHETVVRLRQAFRGLPFHAAVKTILRELGVVGSAAVRPPLRPLEEEERERVLAAAQGELSTSITSPPSAPT